MVLCVITERWIGVVRGEVMVLCVTERWIGVVRGEVMVLCVTERWQPAAITVYIISVRRHNERGKTIESKKIDVTTTQASDEETTAVRARLDVPCSTGAWACHRLIPVTNNATESE
jgi:hypothetical protein